MTKPTYTIRDSRPIADANPWSFYMPCEARRNAVTDGDLVQVVFETGAAEDSSSERMWIAVTGKTMSDTGEELLVGTLTNHPMFIAISHGDEIQFERHAIIDIQTDRKDDPEETCVQDSRVFDRGWIDERVWSSDVLPVKATNGHPQPDDYDGGPMDFPWGGWKIVGADWKEGMPLNVGTLIGVIRRDPGIATHLLGDDVPTVVEKIDGEWRSSAA